MLIHADQHDFRSLNEMLKNTEEDCIIDNCCGERFIAAGMDHRKVTIKGIPGNALGAYLNGGSITVCGNAQDAVGDTMNDGSIVIHGNIGDAAGYAMRGGKMYVKGNAGYRAGTNMKAFGEKNPVMVIGGKAGSFLGEYQAGGTIIVLNLLNPEGKITGFFPCTGMHGGKVFLRSRCEKVVFPEQVTARPASEEDLAELKEKLHEYCLLFGLDLNEVMAADFTVVTPDSRHPYKRMYVGN